MGSGGPWGSAPASKSTLQNLSATVNCLQAVGVPWILGWNQRLDGDHRDIELVLCQPVLLRLSQGGADLLYSLHRRHLSSVTLRK